jgi:hypothetical protein
MKTKVVGDIAVIYSEVPLITNAQSALDLMATVYYEHKVTSMVISKEAISEGFFVLSTGFAGDVVQKFVNYHFRVAIVGDFRNTRASHFAIICSSAIPANTCISSPVSRKL